MEGFNKNKSMSFIYRAYAGNYKSIHGYSEVCYKLDSTKNNTRAITEEFDKTSRIKTGKCKDFKRAEVD